MCRSCSDASPRTGSRTSGRAARSTSDPESPMTTITAATQETRARAFRALHERNAAFIIPNPWDTGTARLLAHLGFEALATTSMGYAFSAGQRDNTIGRDRMMIHMAAMASATDLPVSADLENGYGDSPETVE